MKSILKYLNSYFNKPKQLLICRFDGIGDYVIMHKFLKFVRNSNKYKNYKIIFAGRNEFSEYAQKFDNEYIDEFIWINYQQFMANKEYRKQCLKNFSKLRVDEVVSPVYDREAYVCEKIIGSLKSKNIIGHKGPLTRLKLVLSDKKIEKANKKYSKFIDTGKDIIFEEKRYQKFFEELIGEKINIEKDNYELPINLKDEYILIAPFSGAPIRTWNSENFIKIINFIVMEFGYNIGILGSNMDFSQVEEIIKQVEIKDKVYNLAGKISLSELPVYLKCAKLLIANETGTVHIAEYTGTKTLCISNGSYMGRFQPYDDPNIMYIYPDGVKEFIESANKYGVEIQYDINEITAEQVIYLLKSIIKGS